MPTAHTAVFITSTGEAPGTNRLEIAGENGKLVLENDALVFTKNEMPMSEFSRTATKAFAAPATQESKFAFPDHGGQHVAVLQDFVDAILDGTPLLAPAREGIRSVELVNAILLSSALNQTIELPLDSAAYEKYLQEKISTSRFNKNTARTPSVLANDFAKSIPR
jgi:predicted dehydrogenase